MKPRTIVQGKLRPIIAGVAVLSLITVAVASLSGWFETKIAPGSISAAVEDDLSKVRPVAVEVAVEPTVEWASGTIESANRTTVAARIVARIEQIHVSAGDEVKRDDVLAELDDRALRSRVQQAQDALTAAVARRDLARSELARAEKLLARGVVTAQRYDELKSALQVAEADLNRATRSLEEARTELSHAKILAPVAGRVIDRLAEPGDTVTPGQGILRLYDPAVLRVEAPVRESLAVNLAAGDVLKIGIAALGATLQGAIEEIVPYAEPGARTLLVKVRLPVGSRVFAGMFARIAVPAGERERLVVPTSVVRRIGQLEFAYVVDQGRIAQRMITTGEALDGARIEVLSGLRKGEMVIEPRAGAVDH